MPFFISANSQAEPLKVKHNSAINGSNAENKKVPILFASPEAYRIWETLVSFSERNLALNSLIYVMLGQQNRVLDINICALLQFCE
jgi:hypothetical protein